MLKINKVTHTEYETTHVSLFTIDSELFDTPVPAAVFGRVNQFSRRNGAKSYWIVVYAQFAQKLLTKEVSNVLYDSTYLSNVLPKSVEMSADMRKAINVLLDSETHIVVGDYTQATSLIPDSEEIEAKMQEWLSNVWQTIERAYLS